MGEGAAVDSFELKIFACGTREMVQKSSEEIEIKFYYLGFVDILLLIGQL